jgi:hypothetical protein
MRRARPICTKDGGETKTERRKIDLTEQEMSARKRPRREIRKEVPTSVVGGAKRSLRAVGKHPVAESTASPSVHIGADRCTVGARRRKRKVLSKIQKTDGTEERSRAYSTRA